MALTHARTQIWLDEATGKVAHVTHHHYDPALAPDGSHYAEGATAEVMRSAIEEVAQGLRAPDTHDLEMLSALVAAMHLEHVDAGVRNADREQKGNALAALVDSHAALLSERTGATIEEVHAHADRHVRTRLAQEHIEHVQRMVKVHVGEWRDQQFAAVTAEVHAHKDRLVTDLHAAVDAEMADMRAKHADLSATIGGVIAELPDELRTAMLAKRPDLQVHVDVHAASLAQPVDVAATPAPAETIKASG